MSKKNSCITKGSFISLDELVPMAREYERGHVAIIGVVLGMIVMAISLWALGVSHGAG